MCRAVNSIARPSLHSGSSCCIRSFKSVKSSFMQPMSQPWLPAYTDGPVNVPSNRLELNARVAATLSTPVLMVLDALEGSTPDTIASSALIAAQAIEREHAEVLGLVLNRVGHVMWLPPADYGAVQGRQTAMQCVTQAFPHLSVSPACLPTTERHPTTQRYPALSECRMQQDMHRPLDAVVHHAASCSS